jgi:hypothetical protein
MQNKFDFDILCIFILIMHSLDSSHVWICQGMGDPKSNSKLYSMTGIFVEKFQVDLYTIINGKMLFHRNHCVYRQTHRTTDLLHDYKFCPSPCACTSILHLVSVQYLKFPLSMSFLINTLVKYHKRQTHSIFGLLL